MEFDRRALLFEARLAAAARHTSSSSSLRRMVMLAEGSTNLEIYVHKDTTHDDQHELEATGRRIVVQAAQEEVVATSLRGRGGGGGQGFSCDSRHDVLCPIVKYSRAFGWIRRKNRTPAANYRDVLYFF